MEGYNIYKDIANRTQGDIYVGVVGPECDIIGLSLGKPWRIRVRESSPIFLYSFLGQALIERPAIKCQGVKWKKLKNF